MGFWHGLPQRTLINKRKQKINSLDRKQFIQNLFKLGYPRNNSLGKTKYSRLLTRAFQRRFRQELVNGIIDKECLLISKNLIKT